jgi:hypothetical protein
MIFLWQVSLWRTGSLMDMIASPFPRTKSKWEQQRVIFFY